jgi:hypothetical protein
MGGDDQADDVADQPINGGLQFGRQLSRIDRPEISVPGTNKIILTKKTALANGWLFFGQLV